MNPEFQIHFRCNARNLHVRLRGDFTDVCAWNLLKLLRQHRASRKVFINTHDVAEVAEEGVELFKRHMTPDRLPKDGLYFKGENGFKIGPDGSRVLLYRKSAGAGRPSASAAKPRLRCVSGNGAVRPAKRTLSFVRHR